MLIAYSGILMKIIRISLMSSIKKMIFKKIVKDVPFKYV